jgi:hypothetical protein
MVAVLNLILVSQLLFLAMIVDMQNIPIEPQHHTIDNLLYLQKTLRG